MRLDVPGSKSLTNRALVIAALADGVTTLDQPLECDDSRHMIDGLRQLGFAVEVHGSFVVGGLVGRIPSPGATLHVGNAGTAGRFLAALVTLGSGCYVIDGVARMRERPVGDLVDALNRLGADARCTNGCFPVTVDGRGLPGGSTNVSGSGSSQFLSALLMVAPYASRPVEIHVVPPLTSRPYVDMTIALMHDFGVRVEREGDLRFSVPRGQYKARAGYAIAPDASSASYLFAAAAILGGRVRVRSLTRRCGQGDVGFVDLLARMGCEVCEDAGGIEVTGRGVLHGIDVDLTDMPDVAPTLAAVAPFAGSATTIRGITSARRKECDRVTAVCIELTRLGVGVRERDDGMTIKPCHTWQPSTVHTYEDHRMAMAFALVGLRVPGIVIENPGCVSKTFPGYFETLARLST